MNLKILALFIILIFVGSTFVEVRATSNLVGQTGAFGTISTNRETFYYLGKHWLFYANASNLCYRTSSDSVTWSAETNIRSGLGSSAFTFSITFNGARMGYVLVDASNELWYRAGVPQSDGSISWIDSEKDLGGNASSQLSIAFDTSGYAWIAYKNITLFGSYYYELFVSKSGNTDGTWGTTPVGFPYQMHTLDGGYSTPQICPLTNGKVAVTFSITGTDHGLSAVVHTKIWSGSAWGVWYNSTSSSSSYALSATSKDDIVHYVFPTTSNTYLVYQNVTYGVGLGVETTIDSGTMSYSAISVNSETSDLYVFYTKYNSGTYTFDFFHIDRILSVWGSSTLIESGPFDTYSRLSCTCSYQNYNGVIGYSYSKADGAVYDMYYGYLRLAVSVTIDSSPQGVGYVSVDSVAITTPQTYDWLPSSIHTLTASSIVLVSAGERYSFSDWDDAGAQSHSYTVTTDDTVTATFTHQFYLTTSANVTVSGITGAGWYDESADAPITAPTSTMITGKYMYSFVIWNGTGIDDENSPSTTVLIDSAKTVMANYTLYKYYLTLTTFPLVGPIVQQSNVTGWYSPNSNCTLTAISPYISGSSTYLFNAWTWNLAGVPQLSKTANPCNITMTDYATAQGVFISSGGGSSSGGMILLIFVIIIMLIGVMVMLSKRR
jgi:hypothetical protein